MVGDRKAPAALDLCMGLAVARSGSGSVRRAGETCEEVGCASAYLFNLQRYRRLDRGLMARPYGLVAASWVCARLGEQSSACFVLHSPRPSSVCVIGILTKWFSSTRLETRTKEFSSCASIRVANPCAQ